MAPFTSSMRALEHPGDEAADEAEVAAVADPAEVLVELVERRPGEAARHRAGVIHRAGAPDQSADARDIGGRSREARAIEERDETAAGRSVRVAQRVDDHQRALAFQQVAVDLLPVGVTRLEVEEVVLDLEGGAEEEPEADQRLERPPPARADQTADAQRM